MDGVDREMTLVEYMSQLIPHHRAYKEYLRLEAERDELRAAQKDLMKKYRDQIDRTARAILARDKLQAQLEAVREYREEGLGYECQCHEAYTSRGMIDHSCVYHDIEPWRLDAILQPDSGKGGE